jgi:hypothetical protein
MCCTSDTGGDAWQGSPRSHEVCRASGLSAALLGGRNTSGSGLAGILPANDTGAGDAGRAGAGRAGARSGGCGKHAGTASPNRSSHFYHAVARQLLRPADPHHPMTWAVGHRRTGTDTPPLVHHPLPGPSCRLAAARRRVTSSAALLCSSVRRRLCASSWTPNSCTTPPGMLPASVHRPTSW